MLTASLKHQETTGIRIANNRHPAVGLDQIPQCGKHCVHEIKESFANFLFDEGSLCLSGCGTCQTCGKKHTAGDHFQCKGMVHGGGLKVHTVIIDLPCHSGSQFTLCKDVPALRIGIKTPQECADNKEAAHISYVVVRVEAAGMLCEFQILADVSTVLHKGIVEQIQKFHVFLTAAVKLIRNHTQCCQPVYCSDGNVHICTPAGTILQGVNCPPV